LTKIVSLSVGKDYSDKYYELEVRATGNHRSVSSEICKAIAYYMEHFEDEKLLASNDKWNDFIKNADRNDLMEMNTYICELSQRMVAKWKKKN